MNAHESCRKDDRNPTSGLLVACDCRPCSDRNAETASLESCIVDVVDELLLDHCWRPARIVEEITRVAPDGSLAPRLVAIELICRAGRWLSRPELGDLLDDVDDLADSMPENGCVEVDEASGFELVTGGFHVGTTVPGWLSRDDVTSGGLAARRAGVIDLLEAADELENSAFA